MYVSIPAVHVILQDGFNDKVTEMSNLRWLRLKRTQMKSLPEEIDRFSKLVCECINFDMWYVDLVY